MHANIDTILLRANAIFMGALADPSTGPDLKEQLTEAYRKMNAGRLPGKSINLKRIPEDPDGSETLCAARLVATAMGLKLLERSHLDQSMQIGPEHMVVVRHHEAQPQLSHLHQTQIQRATLFLEITCGQSSLSQNLQKRRRDRPLPVRQLSLY